MAESTKDAGDVCYVCVCTSPRLSQRAWKTLTKKCMCWKGNGALEKLSVSLRGQWGPRGVRVGLMGS